MKKMVVVLAFVMCAVMLAGCAGDGSKGFVAIDINPQFELITDGGGKVISVRAGNEDGQIALYDLEVRGLSVERATEKIVASCESLGFLTEKNKKVNITATSDKLFNNSRKGVERGSKIAEASDSSAAIKGEVEALKKKDPALYEKLTPGHLRIIYSAMEYDKNLTVEQGAQMEIGDLQEIIKEGHKAGFEIKSDELELKFDTLYLEKTKEIDAKIDAFYGEEYAALAPKVRALELLEDEFDNYFDKLEDEKEEDEENETDEDESESEADELLTGEMIAKITAILPDANFKTPEELEDAVEEMEEKLEDIEDSVTLSDEDKKAIKDLERDKKQIKSELKDEMKEEVAACKKQIKEKHDKLIKAQGKGKIK